MVVRPAQERALEEARAVELLHRARPSSEEIEGRRHERRCVHRLASAERVLGPLPWRRVHLHEDVERSGARLVLVSLAVGSTGGRRTRVADVAEGCHWENDVRAPAHVGHTDIGLAIGAGLTPLIQCEVATSWQSPPLKVNCAESQRVARMLWLGCGSGASGTRAWRTPGSAPRAPSQRQSR